MQRPGGPVLPVLRWSPTVWRRIEAIRDQLMHGLGTDEPYAVVNMVPQFGLRAVSVQWRRPLRIDEVNQLAPTEDVRQRKERP
jgi:hypothetical protein